MPLHLALLTLHRLLLGIPQSQQETRAASESLLQAIRKVSSRHRLFSLFPSCDHEEIQDDLFLTFYGRLAERSFSTEKQAYRWLILSIDGSLKDRLDQRQHLTFFADLRNDEHSDQEPERQDDSSPNPEEQLEQLQQITALDAFQKQKEAFVNGFLQTFREKKRPQKRQTIEEMEAIHFYENRTFEEVIQQSGEKKNTLQQRHCRLRAEMQAYLHSPPCRQIPTHDKETLFAWLALLDGKPGTKYDL